MRWALCELERNPQALFYERDLRARFGDGFDVAVEAGLLRFVQPPEHGGSLVLSDGCRLSVLERDGQFWGVDEGEEEAEPVPLTAADLSRYGLSLDAVAARLREANELEGQACEVGDRLYYLGFRPREGINSAVLLAFFSTVHTAFDTALSVPTRVSGEHQQYILVCPSFALQDQAKLRRFQDANVFLCRLDGEDVWQIAWPIAAAEAGSRVVLVLLDSGMVAEYYGIPLKLTRVQRGVLMELARRTWSAVPPGDLKRAGGDTSMSTDFANVRRVIKELRAKLDEASEQARADGRRIPGQSVLETVRGEYGDASSYRLALRKHQVKVL